MRPVDSASYQVAAGFLLLFVFFTLAWTIDPIVAGWLPGGRPPGPRLLYVVGVDLVGLTAVAGYFRSWSLLWQAPLQALAAVLLFKGVGTLIRFAFEAQSALLGPAGLAYLGLAVAGALAALAMKWLQVTFLGGHLHHAARAWRGRRR